MLLLLGLYFVIVFLELINIIIDKVLTLITQYVKFIFNSFTLFLNLKLPICVRLVYSFSVPGWLRWISCDLIDCATIDHKRFSLRLNKCFISIFILNKLVKYIKYFLFGALLWLWPFIYYDWSTSSRIS